MRPAETGIKVCAAWGILAILVAVMISPAASAEDWDRLFKDANRAYSEKDYAAARDLYLKIADEGGVKSSPVFYNLGNAYFHLGELGNAILYYERARRLSPRDRDILRNLKVARKHCLDKPISIEQNVVMAFFGRIASKATVNEWTVGATVLLFLAGAVFTLRVFLSRGWGRPTLLGVGLVVLVFWVWLAGNAWNQARWLRVPRAVVVSPEVKVYPEPRPRHLGSERFVLREGTEVEILEADPGSGDVWNRVQLEKGIAGWCPGSALAGI